MIEVGLCQGPLQEANLKHQSAVQIDDAATPTTLTLADFDDVIVVVELTVSLT